MRIRGDVNGERYLCWIERVCCWEGQVEVFYVTDRFIRTTQVYRRGTSCWCYSGIQSRTLRNSFKTAKKKDISKFRKESFDHVEGFFKMLKDVEKSNPGILSYGYKEKNMDETSIMCEFEKRTKGFGCSQTHHRGFAASSLDSIKLQLKALERPSKW